MATILIDTDQSAVFQVLKDQDGALVEGATVTVTLLDKNGKVLADQPSPFPLTMADQGEGVYQAHIPHDHAVLNTAQKYQGLVKAVSGNLWRTWTTEIVVKQGSF